MSDSENEEVENIDFELVSAVKCNRFLFDKKEKMYANVSLKKDVWALIGKSLSCPVNGKFISNIINNLE